MIGFNAHLLGHEKEQVAHVGIGVRGAAAEAVVGAGLVERVTVKVALVEVHMASVLQAEIRAASEYQWQIGVAMAVTVGHAAAEERHG